MVNRDYFFPNNLNLFNLNRLLSDSNYFLDDLWNLKNLLDVVVNNDYFLDYSINDLNSDFNLDVVLLYNLVLGVSNDFLYYFLHFNYLWNINYSFNNLFNVNWNLNRSFHNSLNRNQNFL